MPCTLRVTSTEEGIDRAGLAAVLVGVTATEYTPTVVADDQLSRPAEVNDRHDGSVPAAA